MGKVRNRFTDICDVAQVTVFSDHGAIEILDSVHDPFGGLIVGSARIQPGRDPGRRHDGHFAFYTIEHGNNGRAQQDGVRYAQGIRVHIRKMLNQPDHIVSQISKKPCCNLGQVVGHLDTAFRDQITDCLQGICVEGLERFGIKTRRAVDLRAFSMTAPDQVRFHPNHGIAATNLAACDGFQHEAVFPSAREFHHHGHGRVEISRKPCVDQLVFSTRKARFESCEIRKKRHAILVLET